ncbi:MAG: YkgJ family cysteine cluster protein [Treponema sp.]|nr:YkgJ family cysteine cluster protein [Treponema sp.]
MAKLVQERPVYAGGKSFSCTRCSSCCRHESGYVFLSEKDAVRLGEGLRISFHQLLLDFCRWIPVGDGAFKLSLQEKANFDCVFWEEPGGCSVYQWRPLQCRAFPFWESALKSKSAWREFAKECPGIGQGRHFSQEDIEEWLVLRKNEPIICKNI